MGECASVRVVAVCIAVSGYVINAQLSNQIKKKPHLHGMLHGMLHHVPLFLTFGNITIQVLHVPVIDQCNCSILTESNIKFIVRK